MKMLRKLSAVLLFAALTLAVLAAANFLLVDDVHSYSRAMLQELYADAGKIDTPALTTRKRTNTCVRIKITYQVIEDFAHTSIGCPHIFGRVTQDACQHRCIIVKNIFLSKRSNTHATRAQNTPFIRLDRAIKEP